MHQHQARTIQAENELNKERVRILGGASMADARLAAEKAAAARAADRAAKAEEKEEAKDLAKVLAEKKERREAEKRQADLSEQARLVRVDLKLKAKAQLAADAKEDADVLDLEQTPAAQ